MMDFSKVTMTLKVYRKSNSTGCLTLCSIFPTILTIWHMCMATVLYQYLTRSIHAKYKPKITRDFYLFVNIIKRKFWRCPLAKNIFWFYELFPGYQGVAQSLGSHIRASDEKICYRIFLWFSPETLCFYERTGRQSKKWHPCKIPSSCPNKKSNSSSFLKGLLQSPMHTWHFFYILGVFF